MTSSDVYEKRTKKTQIIEKRSELKEQQIKAASQRVIEQLGEEEHFFKSGLCRYFLFRRKMKWISHHSLKKYPNKIFAYPKIVNEKIQYLQVDTY